MASPPGLDPRIPAFVAKFFQISDDESATEEYPEMFTSDASFKFFSLKLAGTQGMKEMRALMWKNPVKRWHDVKGLFASNTPLDFMMYGTVTQRLQKEDVVLDWAGHMILEDRSGQLFVKDYQVFADNTPLYEAMARQ